MPVQQQQQQQASSVLPCKVGKGVLSSCQIFVLSATVTVVLVQCMQNIHRWSLEKLHGG